MLEYCRIIWLLVGHWKGHQTFPLCLTYMQYNLTGFSILHVAQYNFTAEHEIIETAKPSPISQCLTAYVVSQSLTGNAVFDHRVTGPFGKFLIAHNTVLCAKRVILPTSECPRGGTLFSRYIC